VGASKLPPYYKGVNLRINLEEGKEPLFRPLYYHSLQELAVIHEYIQIILVKGWIRPSKSSIYTQEGWGCVNYYKLNIISLKNYYSLPLINKKIACLSGMKIFT
jgi:hypothetical protein